MATPSPLDLCWKVKDLPSASPIMPEMCAAIEKHWAEARAAAISLLGDEGLAAEMMEGAIAHTVNHLAHRLPENSEEVRVVLSKFLKDEIRCRRRRYTQFVVMDFAFTTEAWSYRSAPGADAAIDAEQILRNAPPEIRRAMMMRYGYADSWREVAAATGTNPGAIRKKCKRWLNQIRHRLGIPYVSE